jgi:hypothetical protein
MALGGRLNPQAKAHKSRHRINTAMTSKLSSSAPLEAIRANL